MEKGAIAESPSARSVATGSSRLAVGIVCAVVGGACLALALYHYTVPGALFGIHPPDTGYDDGVYLAVSLRFVHGVLAYRDFLFIQPPGVAWVMAPVALLGRVIGTADALVAARIVTAVVGVMNAALVALALRRRGVLAMCAGGLAMALFPLAASALAQDELEPYVVLFSLLAIVVAFWRPQPSTRRLVLAGILVGVAATVKLVAALPAGMLMLVFLPEIRRMRAVAAGAVVGFVLPCLPFFIAAPSAFVREVFFDQLGRNDRVTVSVGTRIEMIMGIGSPANVSRGGTGELLLGVLAGATVAVYLVCIRRMTRFEWYVALSAVAVIVEYNVSKEFFDHYAYFPAMYLSLVLGIVCSRLRDGVAPMVPTKGIWLRGLHAGCAVGVALVVTLIVLGIPHIVGYEYRYVAGSTLPAGPIDAALPAGACVVSDQVTVLLEANRFDPAGPGCPEVIDNYGTFIADDDETPPPGANIPMSFIDLWKSYFAKSDAVVLSSAYSSWIPSDASLRLWFAANFRRVVAGDSNVDVYVNEHHSS
ncbi:MAG: glycosyltransferase family 87 protein [Candidatus Limnocylindrales bacterium]